MLELHHITKSYVGKGEAVSDVSFTLPRGQIVGLFGENGAGKTTLMKCILGLIRHQGAVLLDGEPISRKNIAKLSFATSEHSFFPLLTPLAHRDFYKDHFSTFRDDRFQTLMDFFELPGKKPLRTFSTGQKNQFETLLALSQGADYILMDEPFAGNDIFNREDFYKVLLGSLEPHETVLLSTHLLDEVAPFVGRALLLRKGKLIGDADLLDLEDQGKDLVSFVRETYHYQADRVLTALDRMNRNKDEEG